MKDEADVVGVAQGETAGSVLHGETAPQAARQEIVAPAGEKRRPGPFRRFLWSLVSHIVFAGILLAGVLGYLYQREILTRVSDEICNDARLGQYLTRPRSTADVGASKADWGAVVAPPTQMPGAASQAMGTGTPPAPVAAPAPVTAPMTTPAPAPAEKTEAAPPQVPASTPAAPVASATPEPPQPASGSATPPPPPVSSAISAPVAAPEPAPVAPVAPEIEVKGVMAPAPAPDAVAVGPATPPTSTEAAQPPTPASSAEKATSEHVKTAAVQEPSPEPADSAAAFNQSVLNSEWQAARRAYLEGKANAADEYRKLVAKYPDIADLRGELGNILYNAGQMKEAADQYYAAALRHLTGPRPELAACLADVVKKIDQPRGEELQGRITQPCPYQPPK